MAEGIEPFLFAGIDEDERHAFLAGARGTTASMRVHLGLFGKLVVDDEGKSFNVDSACCHIRGNEKLGAFFFKGAHDLVSFGLGEVALENIDGEAALGELLSENAAAVFGATEDEAAIVSLSFEEVADEVGLVFLQADGVAVDVSIDHTGGIDFDRLGFWCHANFDELAEGFWKSRREEPGCFAVVCDFDRVADLWLEAHAEHLVCFIEDEILDVFDGESLALEKIKKTTRSGDDDLRRTLEPGDLQIYFVTSGENFDEGFLVGIFGELEKRFADLFREFASGREDESLDMFLLPGDFGEQGKSEGGGFPRAGLRLANEVMTLLHEIRNGLGLHGGGLADAQFVKALDEVGRDAE